MSRRKGPRGLRPEEAELWEKIAARTEPLHPGKKTSIAALPSGTPPPAGSQTPARPLVPFTPGQKAAPQIEDRDLAQPIASVLRDAPVRMDRKAHRKLTRGKLSPEARIDLHGMTLADAHPALIRFVSGAHAQGLRLVLVITGKGKDRDEAGPIPIRPGVLRHQVPHWLTSGALRALVLQVNEAHRSHGGAGAYYVYLRRRK